MPVRRSPVHHRARHRIPIRWIAVAIGLALLAWTRGLGVERRRVRGVGDAGGPLVDVPGDVAGDDPEDSP